MAMKDLQSQLKPIVEPMLIDAAKAGDESTVQRLVREGASVNCTDKCGNTPLIMATKANHTSIVRFLCSNGAEVDKCKTNELIFCSKTFMPDGLPPLFYAAKNAQVDAIEVLVEHGANPHQQFRDTTRNVDWTAVRLCAESEKDARPAIEKGLKAALAKDRLSDAQFQAQLKPIVEPMLIDAAKAGVESTVQRLVREGASVNCKDRCGNTPLIMATKENHTSIVRFLCSREGASVNCTDKYGNTPLIMATKANHTSIVRFLCSNGAEANKCKTNQWSFYDYDKKFMPDGLPPLFYAAQNAQVDAIEVLVEHGANPHQQFRNTTRNVDWTAVRLCAECGIDARPAIEKGLKAALAKDWLSDAQFQVQLKPIVEPMLIDAAKAGVESTVQRLVREGASVNCTDKYGNTPLIMATKENHTSIVRFLCSNGAEANQCKTNQWSFYSKKCMPDGLPPLFYAAKNAQVDAIEVLVEHGANPHQQFRDTIRNVDRTAVRLCAESEKDARPAIEKGLKAALAKDRLSDAQFQAQLKPIVEPMLIDAAKAGNTREVQRLFRAGTSLNCTDKYGNTPLIMATKENHTSIVRFLCSNGAEANQCKTNQWSFYSKKCMPDGLPPLFYAAQNAQVDAIEVLVEHGANPHQQFRNTTRNVDWTAVGLCAECGKDARPAIEKGLKAAYAAVVTGAAETEEQRQQKQSFPLAAAARQEALRREEQRQAEAAAAAARREQEALRREEQRQAEAAAAAARREQEARRREAARQEALRKEQQKQAAAARREQQALQEEEQRQAAAAAAAARWAAAAAALEAMQTEVLNLFRRWWTVPGPHIGVVAISCALLAVTRSLLSSVLFFCALSIGILLWNRSRAALRARGQMYEVSLPSGALAPAALRINELRRATSNFSIQLGEGGFGAVFHALSLPSLPDHGPFAIKVLSSSSLQGSSEFMAEIELLSRCRHENLLPLLAFCPERQRQSLVYPLMKGGNLEDRLIRTAEGQHRLALLGHATPPPQLSWRDMLRIVRDATRALCHLHAQQPPVLHRDVKPANILLDEQLNAKIADVGLAKQAHEIQQGCTHVTTRNLVGTAGFIDPLYSNSGHYSATTDGYALGITLLMCLLGVPAVNAMAEAEDMLEDPKLAPSLVKRSADWPGEVAIEATKIVVGLSWVRTTRRRLSLTDALLRLEQLATDVDVRTGIADMPQLARECVVCMLRPRAVRFGCGHSSTCAECAAELQQRHSPCPNCRVLIRIMHRGENIANEPTFISSM